MPVYILHKVGIHLRKLYKASLRGESVPSRLQHQLDLQPGHKAAECQRLCRRASILSLVRMQPRFETATKSSTPCACENCAHAMCRAMHRLCASGREERKPMPHRSRLSVEAYRIGLFVRSLELVNCYEQHHEDGFVGKMIYVAGPQG